MPDSFCITGGGGYLGYHIGKLLKSNGHRVVLFDRAKPPPIWKDNQDEDVLQGFDFVEVSVGLIQSSLLMAICRLRVLCLSWCVCCFREMFAIWII